YSAKLALAAYSENAYLGLIEDFNTVFTAPNLEKQYRYRYKGEYRHTFDIIPDPNLQGKITSKLNLNMKVVSDPYFTHNLERTLPIIRLEKFIGSEYVEGRYVQMPSDTQNLQFDYTLGIPGWGLSLSAAWGFAIFEDKSVADLSDNKRWVSYLQTVEAPVIQLNGSGALDPPGTNAEKKFSLNLGYGLSASYRLKDFYDTLPPFSFSYHDNLLRTALDLSRPIRFEKDAAGNWWKPLDISLTPAARVGFEKYWGGEEIPAVNARNLHETRIFFNLGAGFVINFPSAHVKQNWDQSYGFESMLPTASLSANYSIEKEDNLGGNTPTAPTFKAFRTHSAGANFSIGQKGYGLFFIPYLDLAHSFSSDFSLNLLPTLNPDGSQQPLTLGAERINNWNASYQAGLVYRDLFNFTFSLPISFFNRSTTNFIVESRSKTLSAGFSFGNTNAVP
ncbi:MAG: hypothetical protein JNM63_08700, partial [Spirochaetia bacterium]|nr:hypothetical protein [Spirochaetia bacterium]